MTPATPAHAGLSSWFGRAESWLDDRGKGAWIAAMVLGFIFFWPLGLALLAYMIWSKRMFNGSCNHRKSWKNRHHGMARSSTGNSAFDAYREETLRRLEEEQEAFEAFLERLRKAKDQSEFDQFMDERARQSKAGNGNGDRGSDGDDTADRGPLSPATPA